jgi:putative solute:sodium symporter small subunit
MKLALFAALANAACLCPSTRRPVDGAGMAAWCGLCRCGPHATMRPPTVGPSCWSCWCTGWKHPKVAGSRRWSWKGTVMIEWSEHKAYWRNTKVQMLTSLVPFLLVLIVLPLYAEVLNGMRIFGIPLGYFLACHGLLIIAFVTVAVFVNRQDAIDHWHGAHEDI